MPDQATREQLELAAAARLMDILNNATSYPDPVVAAALEIGLRGIMPEIAADASAYQRGQLAGLQRAIVIAQAAPTGAILAALIAAHAAMPGAISDDPDDPDDLAGRPTIQRLEGRRAGYLDELAELEQPGPDATTEQIDAYGQQLAAIERAIGWTERQILALLSREAYP